MRPRLELLDQDSSSLAFVDLPPWEEPPSAVLWRGRLFLRDPCNFYRFREGQVFYASTLELLELKRRAQRRRSSGA